MFVTETRPLGSVQNAAPSLTLGFLRNTHPRSRLGFCETRHPRSRLGFCDNRTLARARFSAQHAPSLTLGFCAIRTLAHARVSAQHAPSLTLGFLRKIAPSLTLGFLLLYTSSSIGLLLLDMPRKMKLQLAATHAAASAAKTVDMVHAAAGTTGIREEHRLQRHFRDVHTITQHGFISRSRYESVGQLVLGVPVEWPFYTL